MSSSLTAREASYAAPGAGVDAGQEPGSPARRGPGPVLLGLLGVGSLVACVWLDLVTTTAERDAVGGGTATSVVFPGVLLAIAAAVVLHARAGDRTGRVMAVVALLWCADGVLAGWMPFGYARDLPLTDFAVWFVARLGAALLSGLVAILLVYPTGRLLPGRARPVALTVLVASFALPLGLLLAPHRVVFSETPVPGTSTDALALPLTDGAAVAMLVTGQVLTFTSIVAAVTLLWVRHRVAGPHERAQLRWLLWAGLMCVLTVLAGVAFSVGGPVTSVLLSVAVAALSASLVVGLLRPGLGDVDALVAWTLTSAAVAVVVVLFDLLVLATAGALLGDRLDEREVTLGVLVLAVVVYGPLRSFLGGGVRRLLFGRRGDRYGAVSELAARLETSRSVEEQLPALVAAVAGAFKVPYVRVEVVAPDGGTLAATHGREPGEVQELDIAYRGDRVGRLVLPQLGVRSMLSRRDQGLLVDLVRQAAIAIRASLLAAELQESRERLVLGREDDRRRIRRDLHDGLGPALGGVALRLQAADNAVAGDPDRARELVSLARTEVQEALADVRRLVHDLRPPALDDLGLEVALRQQAERMHAEVDVTVSAHGLDGLPAAVEVAAYRIVSEALTNVVRHARATHATVDLRGDGTALSVTVADDGRGIGEDVTAGVGLLSLRERAEELGGHCEVRCPEGGGTTVHAWLPAGGTTSEERSTP